MARINPDGTVDPAHGVSPHAVSDTNFHNDVIIASVNQLRAVFGDPSYFDDRMPDVDDEHDVVETSVEWRVQVADGATFTIHDWHGWPPAACRPNDRYSFRIGTTRYGRTAVMEALSAVKVRHPRLALRPGGAAVIKPASDAGDLRGRIDTALDIVRDGIPDGDHHKMWMLDQMVRALTGCPTVTRTATDYQGKPYEYPAQGESPEYLAFVAAYCDGNDGPETFAWDEGIAP